MQFTLTIQGNSYDELAELFERHPKLKDETKGSIRDADPDPQPDVEEEQPDEEPVTPAPKKSRGKKATTDQGSAPPATEKPSAEAPATAPETGSQSSSSSEVTLDDIRNKASALMDAGKQTGAQIQNMLVTRFNARAFGQLKPEQYADVIGELNNLG